VAAPSSHRTFMIRNSASVRVADLVRANASPPVFYVYLFRLGGLKKVN
jgi:hypothetical protein